MCHNRSLELAVCHRRTERYQRYCGIHSNSRAAYLRSSSRWYRRCQFPGKMLSFFQKFWSAARHWIAKWRSYLERHSSAISFRLRDRFRHRYYWVVKIWVVKIALTERIARQVGGHE